MFREEIPYQPLAVATTEEDRKSYWETGASLQATDGLQVSAYAQRAALRYVAGEYTSDDLASDIANHYASNDTDEGEATRDREADIVAARIAGILEGESFLLSPGSLLSIHTRLFEGVLPAYWVGTFRRENITKAEPVLAGRSVAYADFCDIKPTLAYDFDSEKDYSYSPNLSQNDIAHFSRFIAGIWQIHPFREGNTRTTAVFSELYLKSLGFNVTNEPFVQHATLYRDMLARASFASAELGIRRDFSFLTSFYENLALSGNHDLGSLDLNVHGIRPEGSDTPRR